MGDVLKLQDNIPKVMEIVRSYINAAQGQRNARRVTDLSPDKKGF